MSENLLKFHKIYFSGQFLYVIISVVILIFHFFCEFAPSKAKNVADSFRCSNDMYIMYISTSGE